MPCNPNRNNGVLPNVSILSEPTNSSSSRRSPSLRTFVLLLAYTFIQYLLDFRSLRHGPCSARFARAVHLSRRRSLGFVLYRNYGGEYVSASRRDAPSFPLPGAQREDGSDISTDIPRNQPGYLNTPPGNSLASSTQLINLSSERNSLNPTAPRHFLSPSELGIVKVINCHVVQDILPIFPLIYGESASYDDYVSAAVRRLFADLEVSNADILLKAYRATWPTATSVALCRAYLALFCHLGSGGSTERMLGLFADLLDHPLLLRTHVFHLCSQLAYRTFVDGWVLPVLFLNIFRLYGPRCFMQVPVFTSFQSAAAVPPLPASEPLRKRDLFVNFQCFRGNKLRRLDVTTFHTAVMEACVHARESQIAISVYFSNLYCNEALNEQKCDNSAFNFRVRRMNSAALASLPPCHGLTDLVRKTLDKTAQIDGSLQMGQPSSATVDADIERINWLDAANIGQANDVWSRTLMLKHALYNTLLSVDVETRSEETAQNRCDMPDINVAPIFAAFADVGYLESLPDRYHQVLLTKAMFKPLEHNDHPTVDELMELLGNADDALPSEAAAQSVLNFLHRPLGDTFLNSSPSTGGTSKRSLNSTIRELRDSGTRLADLGASGVYAVLRQFLSFGVSGSAAVQLFALVFPEAYFQAWSHYHVFLCAFECDMERRDVASLDRLLDLMLRWSCAPEPSMYARFFELCASRGSYDLIVKHGRAHMDPQARSTASPARRFGLRPYSRVSFEMYFQLLSAHKRLGRHRDALLTFKRLLLDLQGLYRVIPARIWQLVRAVAAECDLPPEFNALAEQCESVSTSSDASRVLEAHARGSAPYSRPVIARELESLVDRFVNAK
ncbi:chromosome segregation protein [Babesia caballi]|uniref:Chromosome segregation protein n=1 Tax=Babesia caballi TaxID=5871 RepID=A0AAV4LPL0_BABCB|nr:chromosome segregation protein [Babesia caballi]